MYSIIRKFIYEKFAVNIKLPYICKSFRIYVRALPHFKIKSSKRWIALNSIFNWEGEVIVNVTFTKGCF